MASNPLFKPDYNDQLINWGVGTIPSSRHWPTPFQAEVTNGLMKNVKITRFHAEITTLSRNSCAQWKAAPLVRGSTVGNQRNKTNLLCLGALWKGGEGGKLGNLPFVHFVFHLHAGLCVTEGAVWPRVGPGCELMLF